ncbi:MAG: efflux RND transporter periplasmic adaptor subunit, partial [Rivularia sp. (in: cyanobacteria)]
EVTRDLFEGDAVVTQRATQLYAQSLRGGSNKEDDHDHSEDEGSQSETNANNFPLPLWLIATLGGTVVAGGAFAAGTMSGRRSQRRMVAAYAGGLSNESITLPELEEEIKNNHHEPITKIGQLESTSKNNSDS